jgi:hypothetical protein
MITFLRDEYLGWAPYDELEKELTEEAAKIGLSLKDYLMIIHAKFLLTKIINPID